MVEEDVLDEWKRWHFVRLEPDLVRSHLGVTVLLTDYKFWANHLDELMAWCQNYGAVQKGMTVDMDEKTFLIFVLRWSGQIT